MRHAGASGFRRSGMRSGFATKRLATFHASSIFRSRNPCQSLHSACAKCAVTFPFRKPMVTIASQLAEPFNDAVRALLPDVQVVGIPRGVPAELPDETSILVAAPIIIRGARAPEHAPSGWPFGLSWVQLGLSGIDFYPHWFFEGPPVTTARGTS